MAIGIGHDRQDDYSATAVDFFMDLPIGRNGVTAQWNHTVWDGKTWLPTLLRQTTEFAEFGYRIGAYKISPMLRYEARKMDVPSVQNPDETKIGAGLAWWPKGHQNNLKLFYTRVEPKNVPGASLRSYDQFNLQWQVLFF
jgi:hypothetical protein